jgi:hypothetical protein
MSESGTVVMEHLIVVVQSSPHDDWASALHELFLTALRVIPGPLYIVTL